MAKLEKMEMDKTLLRKIMSQPRSQLDLDKLTAYNTTHNRRIPILLDDSGHKKKSKERKKVTFNQKKTVLTYSVNIDSSVGGLKEPFSKAFTEIMNNELPSW